MVISTKKFFKLFITYLVISVTLVVCILTVPILKFQSYRSLGECVKSVGVKSWLIYFMLVIICSVVLGFSKSKKLDIVTTIVAIVFVVLSIFNGYAIWVSGQWSYSQTNLIENYLILDNDRSLSDVDHFPEKQKLSNTENAEYYYFYDKYKHNSQIYLTISYDEQTFLSEKQKIISKYQNKESIIENDTLKICISYFVYEELDVTEKYIFINDNERTIKYYTYVEWFQL